jgi:hypothetical protein
LSRLSFEDRDNSKRRNDADPWSYKSLPELSALPAAERKDVWKKAVGHAYEQWQTFLVYPSAFILVMPVSYWLGLTFGHDFIGIMTGIMIAGAINERIVFRIARPHLKKIIARDDKG